MTLEQFCCFISVYTHTPLKRITEDASFRDDLAIDSLQMVNLIVGLSEKMQVGIESLTGADDMSTVGGLYRALNKGVGK